ncbi:maternal protein tudor isoform X2 [Orussus abietinus]|uniref:maternal protein tudor isoform X2 n=1 Tax=Orussus abietinus TaxID=222816 RepID=UPI00062638E5|nr:maternal protein tudor isoform X2 [Orussus abietinus]
MSGTPQTNEISLFVTHVDGDGATLKIWGQVDRDTVACVERKILALIERFGQGLGLPGAHTRPLASDILCCARFQNDGYYRARICSIRPDGSVVVQFIDYGNVEVLTPHDIRLLEGIPESENLQSIHPLAIEFILANVMPINRAWDGETIKYIMQTIRYTELKAIIHSTVGSHYLLKLIFEGQDFGELLVSKGMATVATLQDMFRPKYLQQSLNIRVNAHQAVPVAEMPVMDEANVAMCQQLQQSMQQPMQQPMQQSIHQPIHQPVQQPVQQPIHQPVQQPLHHGNYFTEAQCPLRPLQESWKTCVPQQVAIPQRQLPPVQPEALVFKTRVLEIGSMHEVYVSHMEEGPLKFSVQLRSNGKVLKMLMQSINSFNVQPLQEPPLPGSVCLGRYTNEQVLCRAVVMSVMENRCKLYYVDFGHTEVLPYKDIFQLPPQFINPKVLSIRFTLSGLKDINVTQEVKDYFKTIAKGKCFVLQVRPPEGPPLMQYGDLYENGINIKDKLKEMFGSKALEYQTAVRPRRGTIEMVRPSFVESCCNFFVQAESGIKSLESLMSRLNEYAKTAPPLQPAQLYVGLPCAALYEADEQWYRAQVLDVSGDQIKVLYVDYGNEEIVTIAALRIINEDLVSKLSAQAIKCILSGYQSQSSTAEVDSQFESLVFEKKLAMSVIDELSNAILVDLFEQENSRMESIRSHLNVPTANKPESTPSPFSKDSTNLRPAQNLKIRQDGSEGWNKRNLLDSSCQTIDSDVSFEKEKTKSWKEDENEQKRQNNRTPKDNGDQSVSTGQFDRSNRLDRRNDRFNKDNSRSDRFGKNDTNDRYSRNDGNTFNRSNRENHTGRPPNRYNAKADRDNGAQWSDKDSDTSSRGSGGKRGSGKGGYRERRKDSYQGGTGRNDSYQGGMGRNDSYQGGTGRNDSYQGGMGRNDNYQRDTGRYQGNKWNSNSDNERSNFKGGRANCNGDYKSNDGHRFKERKPYENRGYDEPTKSTEVWEDDVNALPSEIPGPLNGLDCIPPPNITVGAIKTCDVVFSTSPTDFYVHLCPDNLDLEPLMSDIAAFYEQGGELLKDSKLKVGVNCIAQYSADSMWYRAVVNTVEDSGVLVQFVDYGNTEVVPHDMVKEIQPEFKKLSVQAIHCRLFSAKKSEWDGDEIKNFSEMTDEKVIEAEFVAETNGVYDVLLREVIDGIPSAGYLNDTFSDGSDLTLAKENTRNKSSGRVSAQTAVPNYVPSGTRWTEPDIALGSKQDVIVTWFINPENFYCQSINEQSKFRSLMNEIQQEYAGRRPISDPLQVGTPVIAVFADDGALYRSEIKELNKPLGHLIQYVDFGNCAIVQQSKMYPVERKFIHLPKQGIHCRLKDIQPAEGSAWSKISASEIDKCFDAEQFACTFHETKDDKYVVSLNRNGADVGESLVTKGLASYHAPETPAASVENVMERHDAEKVDITLLEGQTLHVNVSNVDSVIKFHIQLPSAVEYEKCVAQYMANKDPQMFALPPQLWTVQNQAIACILKDVQSSIETDERFKTLVEGKEVIVHVNGVKNNKLIVEVYNVLGEKVKIVDEFAGCKISPICPMPILFRCLKVHVVFINNASEMWLQKVLDFGKRDALQEVLNEYYGNSGELVNPMEGLVCAALSGDGNWYRAEVIEKLENGAKVHFLDYGNQEDLGKDCFKSLETQFYSPHRLAVKVSLKLKLRGTKEEQLIVLEDHMLDNEFLATFSKVDGKWFVDMEQDGKKLSEILNVCEDTPEIATIEKNKVSEAVVENSYEVVVSHADSPAQFWMQLLEEKSTLEDLQSKLQIIAPTYSKIEGVPEENALCLAVYSVTSQWHRAIVLDADEDITTVRFIDYGNTDIIDSKSEDIKQIPEEWSSIKPYSTKCRLDIIPIGSEDWTEAACERFNNLVIGETNVVRAVTIAEGNPKRVALYSGEMTIGDTLVQEGHAAIAHSEEDLIEEIVEVVLDPRSAFICHIESPLEFWVQEEKFVSDLEVMADRFLVAEMLPKLEKVEEGILCVAKFPEDEQWYRAKVVSHCSDSGTEVLYIDYGNSAVSIELRILPDDLAAIPPLSRKCCLPLPDGVDKWSQEACEKFAQISADGATVFLLDVLEEKENGTSLVKLTLNGESIADILAAFCEFRVPVLVERLPPLGEENPPDVTVSYVESPSGFWTMATDNNAKREAITERLAEAEHFLVLSTFEEGTICAAKFPEDDNWYRARILSHSESGTEVLYIDYGNSSLSTELRSLPEDLMSTPDLAKHCTMCMPESIEAWSEEACQKFIDIVSDGDVIFQVEVVDKEQDPMRVSLRLQGQDVVDILLPLCKATDRSAECDSTQDIISIEATAPVDGAEPIEKSVPLILDGEESVTTVRMGYEETISEGSSLGNQLAEKVKIVDDESETLRKQEVSYDENQPEEHPKEQQAKNDRSISVDFLLNTMTLMEGTEETIAHSLNVGNSCKIVEIHATTSLTTDKQVRLAELGDELENVEETTDKSIELTVDDIIETMAIETTTERSELEGTLKESNLEPEVVCPAEERIGTPAKTPKANKIVPGSISRGVSVEETFLDLPEPRSPVLAEDKIVPGSINRGDLSAPVDETEKSDGKETVAERDTFEAPACSPRFVPLLHQDKVVPGSVSRGVSPCEDVSCPRTPKTPYSEKLVAGVVGDVRVLEDPEDDEVMTIEVVESARGTV